MTDTNPHLEGPHGSADNMQEERHRLLRELKRQQASQEGPSRDHEREHFEQAPREGGTPKSRMAEDFLKSEGISEENQDNLHLGTVIKFLEKQSPGAPESATLKQALAKVEPLGKREMFNETDEKVFRSEVESIVRGEDMSDSEAARFRLQMQQAHEQYQPHYQYFRRLLSGQKMFGDLLLKEKEKVGTSISEDLSGIVQDVKDNYRGMSGTQKVVAIGGLLLAAGMFLSSDNEYVERFKEVLWKAVKIGGGAVVANYAFKLFTGKTALETLDQTVSQKAAAPEAWQKVYKTNAERVGVLRDSIVYLGNQDFEYLADLYRTAKRKRQNRIELGSVNRSDMKPEDIYIALDVFFSKYGRTVDERGHAVNVEDTYRNWDPPATWLQAVSNEMVSHDDIDIGSSVGDVTDAMGNYVERGYNATVGALDSAWEGTKKYARKGYDYIDTGKAADAMKRGGKALGEGTGVLVGGALAGIGYGLYGTGVGLGEGVGLLDKEGAIQGWAKDFYERNFGIPGEDPQVKKFVSEVFEQKAILSQDFPGWIRSAHPLLHPKTADSFIAAFGKPPEQTNKSIQMYEDADPNGSIYIVATSPGSVADTPEGYHKHLAEADGIGRKFFETYLQNRKIQVGGNLHRYLQLYKTVVVDGNARALIRMPKPNSDEWKRRMSPDYGKGIERGEEIFGSKDSINYDDWKDEPWKQEQFRLHFLVDASQTDDIKKICAFLTQHYRNLGLPKKAALLRPYHPDARDNKDVELAKGSIKGGFGQKLEKNASMLRSLEKEFDKIEQDVAEEMGGGQANVRKNYERIKKAYGYLARLAVLGDSEAINFYKNETTPAIEFDPTKDHADFIKKYEEAVKFEFLRKPKN